LDEDRCPLETYLEKFLGLSFPEGERELYPRVFGVLRRVLRQMADVAMAEAAPMPEADARALLEKEFPRARWGEHPHYEWYLGFALRAMLGFATAFRPKRGELTRLDPEIELDPSGSGDPPVKLDLIALYKDASGGTTGIVFRPESYAKIADDGEINWAKLDGKRASLVLLLGEDGNARMQVYSESTAESTSTGRAFRRLRYRRRSIGCAPAMRRSQTQTSAPTRIAGAATSAACV
jgi:hypothetical protein